MWTSLFAEPVYLHWDDYQDHITFINDFSRQQRLCRQGAVMLEIF